MEKTEQNQLKGITQAIALDEGLDFDPLDVNYETSCAIELDGINCRSIGQVVEVLELKAQRFVEPLLDNTFDKTDRVIDFVPLQVLKCSLLHRLHSLRTTFE